MAACLLNPEAVAASPLLALQSIAFCRSPRETFTADDLEAALRARGIMAGQVSRSDIDTAIASWLDHGRIFRTRDMAAYRVASGT